VKLGFTNDWTGLDWTGLDWTGLDWTGLDWTGLDWTGLDWTGLDWTGLDWRLSMTTMVDRLELKAVCSDFVLVLRNALSVVFENAFFYASVFI
jgi:uncharacterized protein YjbI with pentapeptide repeats